MNIREAIAHAVTRLRTEPVGPPRMAAETLLFHVLGCDRAHLHAHPERELETEESERYLALVEERAGGRPLQYITGHQEFWGLDFLVTPDVLIPRPETELLVESALEVIRARKGRGLRIAEVGCGSGNIILALASELTPEEASLYAVDISPAALKVAEANALRLGFAGRVRFLEADLLDCFEDEPETFDLILSNPPYVGLGEMDKVQREVREHEPHAALFAGEDGLAIYRRLIPQAYRLLRPEGWLLTEIGFSLEQPVKDLLADWGEILVENDLQGIPRIIHAQK